MSKVSTDLPSKFQQNIYNTYLQVSANAANRPFKYRKRWDNLPSLQKASLQKLERFFTKHKDIDIKTFFNSPYEVYKDSSTFPINFFTTMKAINLYKIHKKLVEN